MLGHSEPLRRYSERNDGVTDHTERRSGGTASAAIHNSLRSLCRRYTRSQMWERALSPFHTAAILCCDGTATRKVSRTLWSHRYYINVDWNYALRDGVATVLWSLQLHSDGVAMSMQSCGDYVAISLRPLRLCSNHFDGTTMTQRPLWWHCDNSNDIAICNFPRFRHL